jgi:heat shock protein HslJ
MRLYSLTRWFLVAGSLLVVAACAVPGALLSPLPLPTATSSRSVQTSIVSPLAEPTSTPSPFSSEEFTVSELDTTQWVLTSLRGQNMANYPFTLEFQNQNELDGGMVCNNYARQYQTSGNDFMLTRDRGRTRFDCDVPEDALQLEETYLQTLGEAVAYQMAADQLTFQNVDGEIILTFAEQQTPFLDPALAGPGWTLISLRGRDLLEDTQITLNFLQREYEGGVNGYASCNWYGGPFTEASGGRLNIVEISATAQDCLSEETMAQESSYLRTLGNAIAYRIAGDRLAMENMAGETTLVFVRKPKYPTDPGDLIGTEWQLASINDRPVSGQTLAFHSEHVLSGTAGCRDYVASYRAEGDDIWFLQTTMATTDCPDGGTEADLQAPVVTGPGLNGKVFLQKEKLTFFSETGATVVYVPLPDHQETPLIGTEWRLVNFVLNREETTSSPSRWGELASVTGITAIFTKDTMYGSAGADEYEMSYQRADRDLSFEQMDPERIFGADADYQQLLYLELLSNAQSYTILGDQLWIGVDDERALLFRAQE